jgi:hypothetical protein
MRFITQIGASAVVAIALSACGSAASPQSPSPVSSRTAASARPAVPTIGPSVPQDGPFGLWYWRQGGGRNQDDTISNDLSSITQDEANGTDVSSDGSRLASDIQAAKADPPPYDTADWQQAMSDFIAAGNDYASGDTTAGDAEVQAGKAALALWQRTVQPYCATDSSGDGECVGIRPFTNASPASP